MSSVLQIANRFKTMVESGQSDAARLELYAQDAISIEGDGREFKGMEAILAKDAHFNGTVESFEWVKVSEPLIAGDYFTVKLHMRLAFKGAPMMEMEELGVFEVKNDKIVYERYYYHD